jgi:hypothetical protein
MPGMWRRLPLAPWRHGEISKSNSGFFFYDQANCIIFPYVFVIMYLLTVFLSMSGRGQGNKSLNRTMVEITASCIATLQLSTNAGYQLLYVYEKVNM